MPADNWSGADAYELFMGRWSRATAGLFLPWLAAVPALAWLDLGCGTGALSSVLQQTAQPRQVIGVDQSPTFVATAQARYGNATTRFEVGDAARIPLADDAVDLAVSALAFNFFPDPAAALRELRRVVRPGGLVAFYVWDYAGRMEMLRIFWDVAVALDPAAAELDEGRRFPGNEPDALRGLLVAAGLDEVELIALDTPLRFADFDDYWRPFPIGVGPGPSYVAGLSPEMQQALQDALRQALPVAEDGSITLVGRAWAAKGTVPGP